MTAPPGQAWRAGSSATAANASPKPLPFVSVIVPTRNRASFLPYLLDGLSRQIYPADRFELIIVDDASADGTRVLVTQWQKAVSFTLKLEAMQKTGGPASARNQGACQAVGTVLAFTDSDCIPDPGWLSRGARAIAADVDIVCGPTIPTRTTDTHWFLNAQIDWTVRDIGLYRTANLLVSRDAFDSVGGFDETFARVHLGIVVGGEDTDLAWRMRRIGCQVSFVPGASVRHLATPARLDSWLLKPVANLALPRLLRTVPELRQMHFWHGYFHTRERFYFDLAVIGVIVAAVTNWWPLVLTVIPWLLAISVNFKPQLKRGHLHKAAALLLLLTARFLGWTAALLIGSVRYRRLLL